mgnify:CR=1 FL=1
MFGKKMTSLAPLVLRVGVGLVFVIHGYQKLFGGLEGTSGFFSSLGIPAAGLFALIVGVVEFFGGIALLLGLLTQVAGVLLFIVMLIAFLLVHGKNGFMVTNGGYEFVLVLGLAALSLAFSGAGSLSLDRFVFKK